MEIYGLYLYSFLIGSVPTAYLIARLVKGIDVRSYGSGNVGGTNLAQHVGKWWLLPLGMVDLLGKGASPILIGQYALGSSAGSLELMAAPLLALAGHNWSPFLKFQGGRGVAVIAGALLAFSPMLLGAFILVFAAGWLITKSAGVWVLASLATLPFWSWWLDLPPGVMGFLLGALSLVILKRLLSNWTPLPPDLPHGKVLFNRLFRDRDVDSRSDWVRRVPGGVR